MANDPPITELSRDDITKADVAKLHAEINYYVNHQYVLQVAGLTILGVVVAWVSQQLRVNDFKTLDVSYLGCSGALLFLCVLNILDYRLEIGRSICASFLRHAGLSEWEILIHRYKLLSKTKRWLAVSSRHGYYFLLGIFGAIWPVALSGVTTANSISLLSGLHVGICLFYFAFTGLFMPRFLSRSLVEIERGWDAILRPATDLALKHGVASLADGVASDG